MKKFFYFALFFLIGCLLCSYAWAQDIAVSVPQPTSPSPVYQLLDALGLPASMIFLAFSSWMQLKRHVDKMCEVTQKAEEQLEKLVSAAEQVAREGVTVRRGPPDLPDFGGVYPTQEREY